jgi:predicted DNA-binding antitoxin AbrB/MazE fold protein
MNNMKTIHAVYEQGVFRPHESVELPERTEVEFEPKVIGEKKPKPGDMDDIYEIMSLRFNSGERDIAARHNEHQP